MSLYPPPGPFGGGFAPTGTEAAAFDSWVIGQMGVPQPVLMENAGRSAAQVAARLFPDGGVCVLVGPGNNGGDGLVLARTLRAWGRESRTVLIGDRPTDDPLLHGWGLDVRVDSDLTDQEWARLLDGAGLVVDAVLGTGVRGAPRERQAAAIRRANDAGRPVLALDVPSGVDADTGAVEGDVVRADVTVAFGAPKLGSLLHPARAHVGRLIVVEIGFPPWGDSMGRSVTGELVTPSWVQASRPLRDPDTHKNAVGRVLVVAGRPGMAGAAILAARAAFGSGAGYVRVASGVSNRGPVQAAVPEAIFLDAFDVDALTEALGSSDAVVLGPGLGTDEGAAAIVDTVLAAPPVPLVLDADALNLVAEGAVDVAAARDRPVLMTPHPGEMARLLHEKVDEIRADRVTALRAAVKRFGCAVLLKGAPSLVGAPDRRVLVDTQGSSDLAVAGMGDTLCGVCATMLASGRRPDVSGALGLYLSGRAGRLAGRGVALTPSDVVRRLPDALRETAQATTDLGIPGVTFDAEPAR